VIIVAHRVLVSEGLEKRRVAALRIEELHGLPGVMQGAVCGGNRRLEIMETPGRVVLRYVLCVDGAIDLLDHLEVLMDGVAGVGVERHIRPGQLEGSRLEGADVANTDIWTFVEGQTGAPGSEKELVPGR
jgi:hypothetical protein